MPKAVMETSTERIQNDKSKCYHAEYFGFTQTTRVDNIPPNFIDDLANEFLSFNDSLSGSQTKCNIALVLPEICLKTRVDNGLNPPSESGGSIQFRRINEWTDVLKPLSPLRVLLKIERTLIEICGFELAISVLKQHLSTIISCSQGIIHPEYFGFIASSSPDSSLNSPDLNSNTNCHLFRCTSEIQVAEVMQALKSAFNMIASSSSMQSSSSSSSFMAPFSSPQQNLSPSVGGSSLVGPIERLNRLCGEIQNKSFLESHEILQKFIEVYHPHDHNSIVRRVQEAGCETIQETNEIIVSCLLRLAEEKPPSAHHTSVHHTSVQHPSIPSSFSPILPHPKSSTHRVSVPIPSPQTCPNEVCFDSRDEEDLIDRSINHFPENSPMRTMFVNVGNSMGKTQGRKPKLAEKNPPKCRAQTVTNNYNSNTRHHHHHHKQQQQQMFSSGSWRFGILNKVVNTSKSGLSSAHYSRYLRDLRQTNTVKINYLWRKAIVDTMYLIKLNRGKTDEDDDDDGGGGGCEVPSKEKHVREMKSEYDEITPCLVEVTKIWEEMLDSTERKTSVDRDLIVSAMRAGIPRNRRGDIWILLMNQKLLEHSSSSPPPSSLSSPPPSSLSSPPPSSSSPPPSSQNDTHYKDLLKMWTQHQHAILIDLGRTFPGHPYFSTQLGSGQISLFNILKAYSLYDTEVGYCQGISFVAGILLLHIPEEKSFEVLKFMMYTMGFRKQYCPDMVHLQIQLYQLSRLLHDLHRDLYDHFDKLEISPTLYAAPWFLTIFASQFPLGFVARVFDLIFLQGREIVIKVVVVLLGNHKELIKQCEGFEAVVEFLKTTLPEMSIIQMERIINQVFDLDISKHLEAYRIEYHLLREEMLALRASLATKSNNPDLPTSGKEGNFEAPPPPIIQGHQDLVSKVQELSFMNHQLLQQVEQLQSKLANKDVNNSNNDNNTSASGDKIIIMPHHQDIRPKPSSMDSQFQDLLQYSVSMETSLEMVRGYDLPEDLRSELNRVASMKPKWLSASDKLPKENEEAGLENQSFVLCSDVSPHPPPTLSFRNTSSGAPTPYWPLSPLSDGGVGCYLDREVEYFINEVDISQSRAMFSDNDNNMTRNVDLGKDRVAVCRQRPSSNYY